jgi:type I restriction enzyme S subunit
MKVTKLDLPVMSSWMESNGRRLDSNPYLSGAFEAKIILEKLPAKKRPPLHEVTKGGLEGVYHAGRERRQYVDDPAYGVPFLGSTDILAADLSFLSFLSKKQVEANPNFTIQEGWTLITRSGTIGRMVYVRSEMAGMACTEHAMRVVPDSKKVLPGYLYAYLSSKFGVPLVTSGTYGSIIQSIEPQHIVNLPVPRLGNIIESEVHNLVNSASEKRTSATLKQKEAIKIFYQLFKLDQKADDKRPESFTTYSISSSQLNRLDSFHYSPNSLLAYKELEICSKSSKQLGTIAKVFTPNIFKRIHVDEPNWGYPYFSGSELFQISPENRGYLSKKSPNIAAYLVKKDWLLIQDAGQVGGLIGRIVRVCPYADNSVVSNHLMRIVPENREDAAYLFAVLSSPHGYRAIVRHAFGSSIPQLDPSHIKRVYIPWAEDEVRANIAVNVLEAWDLFDQADLEEKSAIAMVNKAIEEVANG